MVRDFDPGALLGRVYTLDDGTPVHLHLARTSDAAAIKRLLEERGLGSDEIEVARLVHFDPRRRYVVCAAGLLGSRESLLGVGAITLQEAAQPDLLAVADDTPPEVAGLLWQALIAAAERCGPSRAA